MLTTIKHRNHPKYTLFVPFTRRWALPRFLLNLTYLKLDWAHTEVVFFNDTMDAELQAQLQSWLEGFKPILNGAYLYQSDRPPLGEFDLVADRRARIIDVKRRSVELIGDSQYVFCLEDDTIAPPDAFSRLLEGFQDKSVGLVSGIQVGRWKYRIIGGWLVEPLLDPTTVQTVPFAGTGLQAVDGTGWYCYLTRTELYKAMDYHADAECLGPDVCYGLDLRRAGHVVLLNWDVKCAHLLQDQTLYPDKDAVVARWEKRDDGSWISVQTATL